MSFEYKEQGRVCPRSLSLRHSDMLYLPCSKSDPRGQQFRLPTATVRDRLPSSRVPYPINSGIALP